MKILSELGSVDSITVNTVTASAATIANMCLDSSFLFTVLTTLMVADFVAGLAASFTTKVSITSRRMRMGVASKLILLLLVASICLVLRVFYTENATQLLTWVFWLFCISEVYSLASNYNAIKTGEGLPEIEVVALLAKRIRFTLERIFGLDKDK